MKDNKLKEFYKGKKVLVTGHTGFKGAWLTKILLEFGAQIAGYSLKPNTTPDLFSILKLDDQIENKIADIRDYEELNKLVKSFKPDIIFHLAAQPLVRDSYDDPKYTYETNVMGTVNVLESIRENNVQSAVIITTDKVYKNLEKDIAYGEEDALCGYDPYSNSKSCADLVVYSYIQSFFNPEKYGDGHKTLVASARSGNVIGGGDWAKDRLIPDAIRSILVEHQKLEIRSPKAIRPWQHVFEPLSGYLMLGKQLFLGETDKSGAWNFGPRDEDMQEVESVIKLLIADLGAGEYQTNEEHTKHEANLLKLSNKKASFQLDWHPRLDLKEAIRQTAEWYRVYYEKKDVFKLSIDQIKGYFDAKQ
jgi:CDP-glucose 4,6-dehydratase